MTIIPLIVTFEGAPCPGDPVLPPESSLLLQPVPATKLAFGWLRLSRCQSCGPISGRGCGSKGLGHQGSPQPQPGLRGPCSQTWELMLHTVEVSIHDLSLWVPRRAPSHVVKTISFFPKAGLELHHPLSAISLALGSPRLDSSKARQWGGAPHMSGRHNTSVATGVRASRGQRFGTTKGG